MTETKGECGYCRLADREDLHIFVYEWLVIDNNNEIATSATLDSLHRESKDFKRICFMSEDEIKARKIGEKLLAALRS